MSKFDASHQSVWKHWEDLDRMNACRKQIETGLKELALKALGALHKKHESDFVRYEKLTKEGWFDMFPALLKNWKKSGNSLLSVGVERIAAENLHSASQYPCLAYVYSSYRNGAKDDTSTDPFCSLNCPPGFRKTFDELDRGYIFTRELKPLTPAEICNPQTLEQYFTEPLTKLIKWYKSNESTILKNFGVTRGKKSQG